MFSFSLHPVEVVFSIFPGFAFPRACIFLREILSCPNIFVDRKKLLVEFSHNHCLAHKLSMPSIIICPQAPFLPLVHEKFLVTKTDAYDAGLGVSS